MAHFVTQKLDTGSYSSGPVWGVDYEKPVKNLR
jgi:hypothetical protein